MRPFVRGAIIGGAVSALVLSARVAARTIAPFREPPDSPAAFLKHGRRPGTRMVVVFAGDSLTHGVVSASYVDLLRDRRGADGAQLVNAGINGNLAWNVLQRLDDVIACRPDAVILLAGTNDVLATTGPDWERMYRRQQRIPVTPTLDWYRENLGAIVARLQAETDARIAILDLPPIGEDTGSEVNGRVGEYNAALREIAAAAGVRVLPLHDRLVALLPDGHVPPPFTGSRRPMGSAVALRYGLRRTWDEVSAARGLTILTDHVHLNERSAAIAAELVEGWLADPQ